MINETKINEGTFIVAGVEGSLEDFAKYDHLTNLELRTCMVRLARDLHEARMKINAGLKKHL
jgi:hypothetical protein|tara:strand:- start:414 stop:599 length:186 start_codon:yes stop_codon:yes gene_type:complete